MSRLKWKVCKKLGKPISDIKQNQAQWLWCYYNIEEDEIEEANAKNIEYETFLSIFDQERYIKYIENKKSRQVAKIKVTDISKEKFYEIMNDFKQYTEPVYEEPKINKYPDNIDEIY